MRGKCINSQGKHRLEKAAWSVRRGDPIELPEPRGLLGEIMLVSTSPDHFTVVSNWHPEQVAPIPAGYLAETAPMYRRWLFS